MSDGGLGLNGHLALLQLGVLFPFGMQWVCFLSRLLPKILSQMSASLRVTLMILVLLLVPCDLALGELDNDAATYPLELYFINARK